MSDLKSGSVVQKQVSKNWTKSLGFVLNVKALKRDRKTLRSRAEKMKQIMPEVNFSEEEEKDRKRKMLIVCRDIFVFQNRIITYITDLAFLVDVLIHVQFSLTRRQKNFFTSKTRGNRKEIYRGTKR